MNGHEEFRSLPGSGPGSLLGSLSLGLGAPAELAGAAVVGAARAHGARSVVVADAVVVVDTVEHERRSGVGLGAVPDLDVLSALMCLPLDAAVAVADLGVVVRQVLSTAPLGCVDRLDGGARVRRRYRPAATVPLVVLRAASWRVGLRRAWAFEPFAARVVLLSRAPRSVPDIAWEADVAGTGLWIRHPDTAVRGVGDVGGVEEVVAPAPFVRRYVKPAGWRFAEHAYAAWLTQQLTHHHNHHQDRPLGGDQGGGGHD
jgi:hypothetical protein